MKRGGGGGCFEAYLEQPVLSPNADEAAPAQIRAKKKGKQRAETEDTSTFELLILMQEMRYKMRGRDEQLREELKWRDNHLDE